MRPRCGSDTVHTGMGIQEQETGQREAKEQTGVRGRKRDGASDL